MKGESSMKNIIFIFWISTFLLLGTSCRAQKEYSEYNSTMRPLNLMNTYTYEELDNHLFTLNKLSADMEFSGIDTLWELDCLAEDTIEIDYNAEKNSGDFKVLLVTAEEKVETILENSDKGVFNYNMPKGKNYIRIVGNQSEVTFSLEYKVGKETKIIMNEVIEDHPYSFLNKIFNTISKT